VEPQKGVDDFLRAAGQVSKRFSEAVFVIAGKGTPDYLSQVQARISDLGLDGRVEMPGFCSDIKPVISGLSILVNASKCIGRSGGEGLPRAVLEAMALEKPVVATDTGGNGEAVADGVTGMVVPPADPDALAAALEKLLEDPMAMEKMGRAGRIRAETLFDCRQQTSKTELIYDDLLANGRKDRS
jgi:glycosyltransferase involved in cell wall biosynthesis